MRANKYIVGVGVLISLSACYSAAFYRGDGRLIDHGWMAYSQRYVLDLGAVDISTAGTYSYQLKNLPNAEFTVGIEIAETEPNRMKGPRPDHSAHVHLELRGENDELIVSENGPLQEWAWSYALGDHRSFLYRRGESKDIPLPQGGSRGQRLGERSSGGWGTYFLAARGKTYLLKFDVLSPNPSKRPARLMLYGVDA